MSLSKHLSDLVRLRPPTIVVRHVDELTSEAVCAAIVSYLPEDSSVYRLRSDHLTEEDGQFIQNALMNGRALVIIASAGVELPRLLLHAWERYCDHPKHTSITVDRVVHFDPRPAPSNPRGMLLVIVPRSYPHRLDPDSMVVHIRANDFEGATSLAVPAIREVGRLPVEMTMRALCQMHHRDPPDAESREHDTVVELINSKQPRTWRELQRVLRQQADDNLLRVVEAQQRAGLVTSAQLDFVTAAVPFLLSERQNDERIRGHGLLPSIYHVLWRYASFEESGYVFRGQRSSKWAQDTTLLRPEKDESPASLGTILERASRTQAFLDELEKREVELVGRRLTEDERLAIAQHYGLPTPLLDYTRSLEVAAFFATGSGDSEKIKEGDIGIIYLFDPKDSFAGRRAETARDAHGFAARVGVRLGELRAIEPVLPDPENRIARQRGLFIDGFESRDLQHMTISVAYFRQEAGHAYEDPRRGITKEHLLNPNAGLQRLAESLQSVATRLSPSLASVRIASTSVFGSLGVRLPGNLHWGQRFLDALATLSAPLETSAIDSVREVIDRHLAEARIAAQTADVAAPSELQLRTDRNNITYALDDVGMAITQLSAMAQIEPALLEGALKHCRATDDSSSYKVPLPHDVQEEKLKTPAAQVAFAAGLFVVGLEHLRSVRGGVAVDCFRGALSMIEAISKYRELAR